MRRGTREQKIPEWGQYWVKGVSWGQTVRRGRFEPRKDRAIGSGEESKAEMAGTG